MLTRICPRKTRLATGHVAVFQEVLEAGKLAPEKLTVVIGIPPGECNLLSVNGHAPAIAPFLGQRVGHIESLDLPRRGEVKRKLVQIQEVLKDH